MEKFFLWVVSNKFLSLPLAFIIVGWLLTFLLALIFNGSESGTFGDTFGAINALFSGLAFVGVIYAIVLQKEELGLQRRELEMTREEMKGQKIALNAQNETMDKQRFENTFFQMLTLYNQIADNITYGNSKGVRAISEIYGTLGSRVRGVISEQSAVEELVVGGCITRAYEGFYNDHESQVGSYLKVLHTLMEVIENSYVENKHFYAEIVKANLSNSELLLVFYHTKYSDKRGKFELYARKFSLFSEMRSSGLIHTIDMRTLNQYQGIDS